MKDPMKILFPLTILTLTLGTALSLPDSKSLILYFGLYVLSFFFQQSMKHGSQFYQTFNFVHKKNAKTIFVMGSKIENDNLKDDEENRFLKIFTPALVTKRRIFSWAIFAGSILLIEKNLGIGWMTIAPVLTSLVIVNSFYSGHLLVGLFLNALTVTFAIENGSPNVWHVLYCASFFINIAALKKNEFTRTGSMLIVIGLFLGLVSGSYYLFKKSEVETEISEFRKQKQKKDIQQAMTGFEDYLKKIESSLDNPLFKNSLLRPQLKNLLNQGKNSLESIRQEIENQGESLPSSKAQVQMEQLQEIAKEMDQNYKGMIENALEKTNAQGLLKKSPTEDYSFSNAEINEAREFITKMKDQGEYASPDLQKRIQEESAKAEKLLTASNLKEGQSQDLEQSMAGFEDYLKKTESTLSHPLLQNNLLKAQIQNHLNQRKVDLENMRKEIKHQGQSTTRAKNQENMKRLQEMALEMDKKYQQMIESSLNKRDSPLSNPENIKAREFITKMKEQGEDKNTAKLVSETSSQKESQEKIIESIDALTKLKNESDSEIKSLHQIVPPQLNMPQDNDQYEKLQSKAFNFKKAFITLLLFTGILYIFGKFRKKPLKKFTPYDEKVLEELRDEWRKLRAKKLSPREEVIQHYNFFQDGLKKIHYESIETPPSCIVCEDLRDITPQISNSIFNLTDIFAHCFYGDKEVTSEMLSNFRKSFKSVLKVYQI
jgi:hypothetical protein